MINIWRVTARLSLVPAKKIRLREIPQADASFETNRLVSQFVSVILAAVNLPFGSRLIFVEISSTLKSLTLAFSTPPIPSDSTAWPTKPMAEARLSSADRRIASQ